MTNISGRSDALCHRIKYHRDGQIHIVCVLSQKSLHSIQSIYSASKEQSPDHFTVVSTSVNRFPQYLAQSIDLLRKYATQKLLICPPHLHNAAALPWKLISSFQRVERCYLP